ncbi:SDR family NAD(P)-dependent oxidoreductase [Brucella pseudogrignonensis]|uniref:SDR family NAD(P)-dependent oxidoreductase n=1 Tax=Brucella pseudogrignonensis TaxID=419475 RepID=UPI000B9893B7|nr:SDR family NAD(P)-dependent oxidoreductase [Brucella pseudogrignonensis]
MAIGFSSLNELVVVVVGASSGFGRGTALKLGKAGANVVLAARRKSVLDELVSEITAIGGMAIAVEADVSDADQVAAIAKRAVEKYGRIDVWINNVGVGAIGYFWEIPLKDHSRLVDVNLKGLIFGAHYALGLFTHQGYGTLINIGSIDSEVPMALQNTYAATKSAVLSLGRSLNEELRLAGLDMISVATIMPWAVDTPWWHHAANYSGHEPRMAMMDAPQIVVDAIVECCLNPKAEYPVGWKAKASNLSHRLMPDLTERLSASMAQSEARRGSTTSAHTGAIYNPVIDGLGVEGGIRQRMKREDSEQ